MSSIFSRFIFYWSFFPPEKPNLTTTDPGIRLQGHEEKNTVYNFILHGIVAYVYFQAIQSIRKGGDRYGKRSCVRHGRGGGEDLQHPRREEVLLLLQCVQGKLREGPWQVCEIGGGKENGLLL